MEVGKGETVLVTGGTGFLGGWMILGLLLAGYAVRTSLRSIGNATSVRDAIASHGVAVERLSFAEADLSADRGWNDAVSDCDYVLHVASPISPGGKNGQDLVWPARDGTLRILRAAAGHGVRRVVQTSSLGAAMLPVVSGDVHYTTDERCWTDPDQKALQDYARSKTLAERAAWEFIEKDTSGLTCAAILPGMIVGPVLTPSVHGSVELISRLLTGNLSRVPRIGYALSDARDLVDIHLKAIIDPAAANQRFAAAGDFLWLSDMAATLRERYPERADRIPTRALPDWILKATGLLQQEARFIASMLGQRIDVDTNKAATVLQWRPRLSRDAVLECAQRLIERNLV